MVVDWSLAFKFEILVLAFANTADVEDGVVAGD